MKDYPLVFIVMRNRNAFSLTSQCLRSLRQLTYPNYHILVVDDGSIDNSPKMLKKTFPYVTLIKNGKYLGYCKGLNLGIREALKNNAEYVFIVNNDTKDFSVNYLEEVVKTFNKDNKVGLVGSKVFNFDGKRIWGGENHRKFGVDMNTPTSGFVVKKEVFKKIGLLDEVLFRFFEDLDFIIRLRKADYKTAFVPTVSFAHLVGGTTTRLGFVYNYYRIRNIFWFLKKHSADSSLKCKIRSIRQLMQTHIYIVLRCCKHGKMKDLIKVVAFVFCGLIIGIFLPYRKKTKK
ncbi:glycosyltransferase family 2 protein [Patescibacteria group bacterium]|nr:glycosyltransferase family 2 protein [Patescibacteria group bacterium]